MFYWQETRKAKVEGWLAGWLRPHWKNEWRLRVLFLFSAPHRHGEDKWSQCSEWRAKEPSKVISKDDYRDGNINPVITPTHPLQNHLPRRCFIGDWRRWEGGCLQYAFWGWCSWVVGMVAAASVSYYYYYYTSRLRDNPLCHSISIQLLHIIFWSKFHFPVQSNVASSLTGGGFSVGGQSVEDEATPIVTIGIIESCLGWFLFKGTKFRWINHPSVGLIKYTAPTTMTNSPHVLTVGAGWLPFPLLCNWP